MVSPWSCFAWSVRRTALSVAESLTFSDAAFRRTPTTSAETARCRAHGLVPIEPEPYRFLDQSQAR